MTKYEVRDKLSEYYNACREVDCLAKRLERLKAITVSNTETKQRIEEVINQYSNAVMVADSRLASTLEIINKLNNTDGDIDLLYKYHIEGLSERAISKQLHLSVDYIRTKRWRAYHKLSRLI